MGWRRGLGVLGCVGVLSLGGFAQEPNPLPANGTLRLAILPLHGKTSGHLDRAEEAIHHLVVEAFLRTRHFELAERQHMDDVLNEAKFENSGLVDDASAAKLGRMMGVQSVVVGSYQGELIAFYGDEHANNVLMRWYTSKLTLNLRLVDVESGKILETFTASGAQKDSTIEKTREGLLKDCALKLEREIANTFPLAGIILRADSEKEVMVDLGKRDGIALGDRFRVLELTQDVVHPVTGKVIKGAPRVIGELKVISVGPESCMMKASSLNGPLKVGYAVESLAKTAGVWEKFMDKVIK